MKQEFGKIKGPLQDFTCTTINFPKFIDLVRADECQEGYFPIVKNSNKPTPGPGEILWFHYHVENGVLMKDYFCRKPPRIISKFNLYLTLAPLGLYDMMVDILKEMNTPEGINAYKAFEIANELSEENPLFFNMLSDVVESLGLSKEEAEELLDKCVAQ